jgi:hypothetical protein
MHNAHDVQHIISADTFHKIDDKPLVGNKTSNSSAYYVKTFYLPAPRM